MRKILKNKVYDTDTAKKVAEYDSGYSMTDFKWFTEDLYLKKTGEYFLHGQGGGLSKYRGDYPGGGWCNGEKIIPLTYEEARTWAEESISAEEYEAIFGEVSEGEDTLLGFMIDKDLKHKLDQEVQKTGKSKQEIINHALDKYLN